MSTQAGASNCSLCPGGYECTSSQVTAQCEAGHFSEPGSADCTPCLAGYKCASRLYGAPERCPLGYFSYAGAEHCSICPAGSFCVYEPPGQPPQVCQDGWFSAPGQIACDRCAPGYYSVTARQEDGPEGAVCANVTKTNCTRCPSGYACPTSDALPVPCPAGTSSGGGQLDCDACVPG